MRSPVRAVPGHVERAADRVRWLRFLDAVAIWLVAWAAVAVVLETATWSASAVGAAFVVALAACIRPLRQRWRPVSALCLASMSRGLKPGDHAWLVLEERVEPVIVTARRRLRLVVASPDQEREGLEIRRTRVVVIPA